MAKDHVAGDTRPESGQAVSRKKLAAHFIDDVSNISIAPNGACRLHFNTWSTDDQGNPLRVESELIMTLQSLQALADALPKAIAQAEGAQLSEDRNAH